jgi:hypothetical protein
MLEILLSDTLSHLTLAPEPEKTQPLKRRQFLKTVGGAGVILAGLTLLPKNVLAGSTTAEPACQEPLEAGLWRDRVNGFIYDVCDNRRAREIGSLISRARVEYRPLTRNFHYYYSAPLIFVGTTISPEEVVCGNGFELNRYPFYDVQCPCGGINDLNAFEIRRVTNDKEIARFGCVLAPHTERSSITYNDHADYRQTASLYGLNPDQFDVPYKRVFKGRGRARYGYQISDKTHVGANNKPVLDVLLSSQDI